MREQKSIFGKYEFSEDEIEDLKDRLPKLVSTAQRAEEKRKETAKILKEEETVAKNAMIETKDCIENGYEMRSILCEVVPNYAAKKINYVDGRGVLIESRNMNAEEIQYYQNHKFDI